MYQDTLQTREVLHDLTMMGSSLATLLNKGKDYDNIILQSLPIYPLKETG